MIPSLSIVIVYFNIPLQFSKTLFSLLPPFQKNITSEEIEIIVVDNGSSIPLDLSKCKIPAGNVKIIHISSPQTSPVKAINVGLNASIGKYIGVMIDGARIASPGLLIQALRALQIHKRAIVGSKGRYLGPKLQQQSIKEGYDQEIESKLLESIDWQNNGYNLFQISVFDESSGKSFLDPIAESNSIFMTRSLWHELNGYSLEFQSPGGGFVNPDTWRRACSLPNVLPVILIGEATFHQVHGGIATNGTLETINKMHDEYRRIRGSDYIAPSVNIQYYGSLASQIAESIKPSMMSDQSVASRSIFNKLLCQFKTKWPWVRIFNKLRKLYPFLESDAVAQHITSAH